MVVVADTTPLNYLVRSGYAEILPRLYGTVVIPTAVLLELQHTGAPPEVSAWAKALPSWVRVLEPTRPPDDELARLGPGERDAILVALDRHADLLLIDERAGRAIAERRGLNVEGTLAVLRYAAANQLLDFDAAVVKVLQLGFRVSRAVVEEVRATLPAK